VGVGEDVGKECRRVNIVQILCMYANGKMRPAKIIPGMRGEGMKENDGGGAFNCDIFDILEELL
jgi:hypothetical protein